MKGIRTGIVSGLVAALAVPAAAAASSSPPRQVVTGIRPSWAKQSADLGLAVGGTPISVRVWTWRPRAVAPGADIAYVGADCGNDPAPLLDALTRIVDHHLPTS